jgi:hypothetical protein
MRIQKPQGEVTCLGDREALKTWEKAKAIAREYAKKKEERLLFALVIPTSGDLRDWWHLTEKDLNLFRFAVRMLRKDRSYLEVNFAVSNRHALIKSKFLRGLEFLAYKYEREDFLNTQMSHWGGFGMTKEEQRERAANYGKRLEEEFASYGL